MLNLLCVFFYGGDIIHQRTLYSDIQNFNQMHQFIKPVEHCSPARTGPPVKNLFFDILYHLNVMENVLSHICFFFTLIQFTPSLGIIGIVKSLYPIKFFAKANVSDTLP